MQNDSFVITKMHAVILSNWRDTLHTFFFGGGRGDVVVFILDWCLEGSQFKCRQQII